MSDRISIDDPEKDKNTLRDNLMDELCKRHQNFEKNGGNPYRHQNYVVRNPPLKRVQIQVTTATTMVMVMEMETEKMGQMVEETTI